MTLIQDLIGQLRESGADSLALVAGHPPMLLEGDTSRPLTEDSLSQDLVRQMVDSLASSEAAGEKERHPDSGRWRFRVREAGGELQVHVEETDEQTRAMIRRAPGAAATASTDTTDTTEPDGETTGGPAGGSGVAEAGASGEASAEETATTGQRSPQPASGTSDPDSSPASSGAGARATKESGEGGGEETTVTGGEGPVALLDRLLRKLVDRGGSDLHVSAEETPFYRVDGEMELMEEAPELSAEQTREMMLAIAPEANREQFERTNDTDFAYEIPGVARFRTNLFMDRKGVGGVFRQIPSEIWTAEDLGLPDVMLEFCDLPKGLMVVTGPTGSGKSTTLAALVDYINRTRRDHIITIEDPIEFTHENKQCLVNQRQVGQHTEGFKVALRAALREDPDIVLIGELRDLETMEIALETAETGHLVFGTLHTNTAASTVSRVIEQFPGEQQNQIRAMLSESLKGVIAQTLCRRKEGGRVAAYEILVVNDAVSNLIREGKTFQIPSVMQTGAKVGMRTMNDALLELVQQGTITTREAYLNSVEKDEFKQAVSRRGMSMPEETKMGLV